MRMRKCAYRGLIRRAKRKNPPARPGNRWEDNIKMHLREVGWAVDWINVAQNRDKCRAVVDVVIKFRIP
jgi:hypothetical protein